MHVPAMLVRTRRKRRIPRLRGGARRARKLNSNRTSVASIARRHVAHRR
jgi:hypothetical protein